MEGGSGFWWPAKANAGPGMADPCCLGRHGEQQGASEVPPPPILESAEAPATQSEGGDTLSQGKALHLRLVGPLWDSQWVG